jgi:hypothetical protein
MQAEPGDLLLFVADQFEVTCKALYGLRKRLAAELKLYDPSQFHFSWVVEFPMFAHDNEEGGWAAMHHPFTAPRAEDRPLLATDPSKCRAQAYDLVINGYEAGGGPVGNALRGIGKYPGYDRFSENAASYRSDDWRTRHGRQQAIARTGNQDRPLTTPKKIGTIRARCPADLRHEEPFPAATGTSPLS